MVRHDPFPYSKTHSANQAHHDRSLDVPSHCFQYTFANNPNWSKFFSPGQEIGEYFRDVAERYDVKRYIRFGHIFKSAHWRDEQSQWEIKMVRMKDNLVSTMC